MKHYEQEVGGVIVRLEASRNWGAQAFHWLFNLVVAYLAFWTDGLTAPPQNLVVRDKMTSKVLFRQGAYNGQEGIDAVTEAVRVIRTLGVDAYIRRESR